MIRVLAVGEPAYVRELPLLLNTMRTSSTAFLAPSFFIMFQR